MQFAFGKNWQAYASTALTPEKVNQARRAFQQLFEGIAFAGKSFLDIGFGQGLAVCLAQEMGAVVLGIDCDAENIAALKQTAALFDGCEIPQIRIVSILDPAFVQEQLQQGQFDIVHAWGVLHHTGNLIQALDHASALVKEGGHLVIAVYNKHWSSPFWRGIKWMYNISPGVLQKVWIGLFYPIIYAAKWLVTRENPVKQNRGMDFWYNLIDWVGGYPYEYASIAAIQRQAGQKNFQCVRVIPAQVPTGCNQFVFEKH